MYMIKKEFESLFRGCNFYLYVIIFNEEKSTREKKRKKYFSIRTKKRILLKKELQFMIFGDRCLSASSTNRRVSNI